jgi:hypothetical protein
LIRKVCQLKEDENVADFIKVIFMDDYALLPVTHTPAPALENVTFGSFDVFADVFIREKS